MTIPEHHETLRAVVQSIMSINMLSCTLQRGISLVDDLVVYLRERLNDAEFISRACWLKRQIHSILGAQLSIKLNVAAIWTRFWLVSFHKLNILLTDNYNNLKSPQTGGPRSSERMIISFLHRMMDACVIRQRNRCEGWGLRSWMIAHFANFRSPRMRIILAAARRKQAWSRGCSASWECGQ